MSEKVIPSYKIELNPNPIGQWVSNVNEEYVKKHWSMLYIHEFGPPRASIYKTTAQYEAEGYFGCYTWAKADK